jgi:signal transduction histidine kinase
MIEQIDGLALIATEFSHFGRLPEANATDFDLRDLAQSAYALHSQAGENITLLLDTPTLPCPVHADKDQLLRVLNNLIRNAIQACDNRPDSRITIAINPTANQTTLSVSDNGPGIPDDVRAKIFQPNFTTKSSGMGLGLAMCRNIVAQAGGEMDFSTQLGVGTTFSVTLNSGRI